MKIGDFSRNYLIMTLDDLLVVDTIDKSEHKQTQMITNGSTSINTVPPLHSSHTR